MEKDVINTSYLYGIVNEEPSTELARKYESDIRETAEKTQQMLTDAIEDYLSNSPLWMRVNYIINTLAHSLNRGGSEEDINWKKVTETLKKDLGQYDFNIMDDVRSMDDLIDIRTRLTEAQVMTHLPWKRVTCKDCRKLFYMSASEVNFYESKNLQTPKRCPECRKARKAEALKEKRINTKEKRDIREHCFG